MPSMKKISKEDWLKTALTALSTQGEEAIRIDKLCKELNVSKGSFYHHFKNIDDFIVQLMKYWEKGMTESIIETTEKEISFDEKVEKLNELVSKADHEIEVKIRAWGLRNEKVKKQIEGVDLKRIEYLKGLYLEQGNKNIIAADFAKLEYALFVGLQHLFEASSNQERLRLSELFQQLLKSYAK
jgi:AcrR family transcriptional regulator